MTNIYLQCKQKFQKRKFRKKELKKKIFNKKNPYGLAVIWIDDLYVIFSEKCHFCLWHCFKQQHERNNNNNEGVATQCIKNKYNKANNKGSGATNKKNHKQRTNTHEGRRRSTNRVKWHREEEEEEPQWCRKWRKKKERRRTKTVHDQRLLQMSHSCFL